MVAPVGKVDDERKINRGACERSASVPCTNAGCISLRELQVGGIKDKEVEIKLFDDL